MMRTPVLRLRGARLRRGPSGVAAQSIARISAPSSPPPANSSDPSGSGRILDNACSLGDGMEFSGTNALMRSERWTLIWNTDLAARTWIDHPVRCFPR